MQHPFFVWTSRNMAGNIFYHFKSLKTGKTLTVGSGVLKKVGSVKMGRVLIEEAFLKSLLNANKFSKDTTLIPLNSDDD